MAWDIQTMTDWAVIAQPFILLLTAGVVAWYAYETRTLRQKAYEAQFFDTLVRVHQQIQSTESHRARRFLYESFYKESVNNWLWNAVKNTPDLRDYLTRSKARDILGMNVSKVLQELQPNGATLRQFTDNLDKKDDRGVSPLDQFERVITDFDIIAIPYLQGVQAMKKVAEEYRDILESTAEIILPFVAIERQLRGGPYIYRKRYLRLLDELGIETKEGWVRALLDSKTLPDRGSN